MCTLATGAIRVKNEDRSQTVMGLLESFVPGSAILSLSKDERGDSFSSRYFYIAFRRSCLSLFQGTLRSALHLT